MNARHTPMQEWLQTASAEQLRDGAIWLQLDSRHLYAAADMYRSKGEAWVAVQVQKNAAYSAAAARAAISKADGSSA